MIHGTYTVKRVIETSICRIQGGGSATPGVVYKIHSNALMPDLPYGYAYTIGDLIDSSIFINSPQCPIAFPPVVYCQNYLSTTYSGAIKKSGDLRLICREGNPNVRSFE